MLEVLLNLSYPFVLFGTLRCQEAKRGKKKKKAERQRQTDKKQTDRDTYK